MTRSATGEFIFKDKEENRKAEEVIGLQYEQFVRTVLLAQGAFDGFLKAESNEKSVLLERLTGITIYQRIAERIRIHHEEAKQRKQDIDSRIGIRKEQLIEDEEEVNELTLSIEKEKEETARIVQLKQDLHPAAAMVERGGKTEPNAAENRPPYQADRSRIGTHGGKTRMAPAL